MAAEVRGGVSGDGEVGVGDEEEGVVGEGVGAGVGEDRGGDGSGGKRTCGYCVGGAVYVRYSGKRHTNNIDVCAQDHTLDRQA